MAEPAVFLIHGLGGTQYDLGSMHKRLKNAGFVTYSLMLPGHGTTPEDLVGVTAEDRAHLVTFDWGDAESLAAAAETAGDDLAGIILTAFRHDVGRDQEMPTAAFLKTARDIYRYAG